MTRSIKVDHKIIPHKYRQVILEALSHYPELKSVPIEFRLARKHPVPYGTRPAFSGFFRKPQHRTYIMTLLEQASGPEEKVLFKNLSYREQLGVIGHELGHVLQYHTKSRLGLLKTSLGFANAHDRRLIERDADIKAIEHGLGRELYMHAVYIRSIKGYVEQRQELNINYLKPHEIFEAVSHREIGIGV